MAGNGRVEGGDDRRARATSSSVGVKTSLSGGDLGRVDRPLPSKPSSRARDAAARKGWSTATPRYGPSIGLRPAALAARTTASRAPSQADPSGGPSGRPAAERDAEVGIAEDQGFQASDDAGDLRGPRQADGGLDQGLQRRAAGSSSAPALDAGEQTVDEGDVVGALGLREDDRHRRDAGLGECNRVEVAPRRAGRVDADRDPVGLVWVGVEDGDDVGAGLVLRGRSRRRPRGRRSARRRRAQGLLDLPVRRAGNRQAGPADGMDHRR